VVIFIFLAALSCVPFSSAAQTMRVRYSGLSGQNLPFWITYETGLYKKYGLTAEMVISSGELDREGFLKTPGK
jgi:ABC-type nitrate/sulfonate/bicarbonate transport system substrate-binding protein